MEFPFGEQVVRERRQPVIDPYDPGAQVPGSWGDPLDYLVLEQAFVASSSSTAPVDATRHQILTDKSLYLTDPDADVRPGDRIRRGGVLDEQTGVWSGGEVLYVNVRPAADTNPFTGWQPVVEIPLDMSEG
ncbi:hypothetical protein [Microbacterium sp. XT11]|uniref:hypothetical protein n=1 Tax=Microbacterium sp. XT11 TaxID=367477 RepID=UPI000743130B|nr:hypothetical protein [Microbacterium sp. XT11]ALX66833.1 hypothetical protein AB663_002275 [Microbacterium sp. XT11]